MIIVPDLKTDINPSEFLRAQTVDASDFADKVEQLNLIYSRVGGQSAGRVFDTTWTTASATFTTDPVATNTDELKTWTGLIFLERAGLGGDIEIAFSAYGSGIEIQTTCTRINDDGTVSNFTNTFSAGASDEWFGGVVNFTNASRRSASNALNDPSPFALSIQARATSAPTVGSLDAFMFFEAVLDTGTIP